MASFVSSNDLAAARDEKRRARQTLLGEEEVKFVAKEKARKRHKESGNDRWMLPGIEQRLQVEAEKMASVSTNKKHKHKKKKKRKETASEDSRSEEEWEEKPILKDSAPLQPDNWMSFDDILSNERTYTSKSIKEKKEEEKRKQQESSARGGDEIAGQHPKELNPYWKDGGSGLPTIEGENHGGSTSMSSKIHKEWLLRSLKRMNEQAEEQDRTVESIAAERYGSWQAFQALLRSAEPERRGRHTERSYQKKGSSSKSTFMRPRDDGSDGDRCSKRPSMERIRDRDSKHKSSKRDKKDYRPSWRKEKSKPESPKSDSSRRKNEASPERHSSHGIREKIGKEEDRLPTPTVTKTKESDVKILQQPQPAPTNFYKPGNNVVTTEHKPVSQNLATPKLASVLLSEKEKNQLAAKILKAELMGNEKLANTLKTKLENAREAEETKTTKQTTEEVKSKSENSDEETVILTRVGKDGQSWPVQHSDMAYDSLPNKRRKKTKVQTHRDGERERYFADDDRHSIQDLVRREKMQEAEDGDQMLSRLASKQFKGTDSEYFTLDDMYVSEASRENTRTQEEARQKQKAISDHKKLARRMENCRLCFGNSDLPKHLLIAIGRNSYLSLPDHKPLCDGHCIIVPMHHCTTGTGMDEDVWAEMRQFMQALQKMFKSQNEDCVFMQTCIGLKKSRHFFIDCLPLPTEEGDMAPIFFKKAIQEAGSEWSHNKKLLDTRGKDFRRCIPKGLPYFSVEFGMDGGFAHVVEDEALFPFYFGREIIGGMLDLEPRLWRHPPKDHFSEQTKRSVEFSERWKPYDWTSNISGTS